MRPPAQARRVRHLATGGALVAFLAGCDAQEGEGYPGEPVARLSGTVVDARAVATAPLPSDPEVSLLWMTGDDDPEASEAYQFERTRVVAGFPARFALDVLALPSADLLAPTGLTLGVLLIESAAARGSLQPPLGLARRDVLLFVGDSPPPLDPVIADRLGLPLDPGLHLMEVVPASADPVEEGGALDHLRPAPPGAAHDVVIEILDREALQLPNPW